MPIRFRCQQCNALLSIATRKQGTLVSCPKCGTDVRVPDPSSKKAAGKFGNAVNNLVQGLLSHAEERQREIANAKPTSYPESFVWWQEQHKGKMFPFACPKCGETTQLRQRVAQRPRICPGCGFTITVSEIDKQLDAMEPDRQRSMNSGCFGLFTMVFFVSAVAFTIPQLI
jgi:predicted RNA-binding Zn-ribbon protein involved in translation (DUF1610 family)